MKILIISPKFHPIIGGGETFVLNSIKRLYDAGIDVSIAVTPNSSRKMTDYPFRVHEVEGLSDSDMSIIEATKSLNSLIKREKPDILHVHGYFALLITGFCNTSDIPVIASIHSTPVWDERIVGGMDDFEVELNFARKALAVGKPKILTAANEVYADAARKIVQSKHEVVVLPYPVDSDSFYKQSQYRT
jgi:glycosyltransferase involved in cell wall biosynthesis